MKTKLYLIASLLCGLTVFTGCGGDNEPDFQKTDPSKTNNNNNNNTTPTPVEPTVSEETKNAKEFVVDVAGEIYLWSDQIASALKSYDPKTNQEVIDNWSKIRYKQGNIEDKWSIVTDDFASMYNNTQNISTTYGWDGTFYYADSSHSSVCFEVEIVYPGSPAAEAGIKRGDLIITWNGKKLTTTNLEDMFYSESGVFGYGHGKLEVEATADLIAAHEFYENPIIAKKIFDVNGKKVGYIHYTSFDKKSIDPLKEISKEFKAAGVKELILDLRYNGGGLVKTEETMAAMYGPWADKDNRLVYQQDVYNARYNKAWANSRFHYLNVYDDDNGKEQNYITPEYNIGLDKIYAIVSSGSASASESILVGLMPYVDIDLVGSENTHGKYCTGWVLSAYNWYEMTGENKKPEGLSNWGFYVMVSSYADKDGNCPIMPNGFTPNIPAKDNPADGYAIGDENESMLKVALEAAGKADTKADTRALVERPALGAAVKNQPQKRGFGMRVDDRPVIKKQLEQVVLAE